MDKNKVIFSKIDPFISGLSYLTHFQAGLNIPREKVFKKKEYPTYLPTLFFFRV